MAEDGGATTGTSEKCPVFFCGTPTFSAGFDAFCNNGRALGGTDTKQILLSQVLEKTKDVESAVLVFLVSNKDGLVGTLNVLAALKKRMENGTLRAIAYSSLRSDRISDTLKSKGCAETLMDGLSQKSLIHKLQKHIHIVATKLTAYRKKMAAAETAAAKAAAESHNLKFVEALRDVNDCWLVKTKKDFKYIRGNWIIEIIGPGPSAGSWNEAGGTRSAPIYRWAARVKKDETSPFVPGGGSWYFSGRKPEFDWKTNRWRFVSENPSLYYKAPGQADSAGGLYRFQSTMPGQIEVALNSAAAKSKLDAIIATFAEEKVIKDENKKKDNEETRLEKEKAKAKGKDYETSISDAEDLKEWGALKEGDDELNDWNDKQDEGESDSQDWKDRSDEGGDEEGVEWDDRSKEGGEESKQWGEAAQGKAKDGEEPKRKPAKASKAAEKGGPGAGGDDEDDGESAEEVEHDWTGLGIGRGKKEEGAGKELSVKAESPSEAKRGEGGKAKGEGRASKDVADHGKDAKGAAKGKAQEEKKGKGEAPGKKSRNPFLGDDSTDGEEDGQEAEEAEHDWTGLDIGKGNKFEGKGLEQAAGKAKKAPEDASEPERKKSKADAPGEASRKEEANVEEEELDVPWNDSQDEGEQKEPTWKGTDVGRGNKFNAGRGVGQGKSESKGYKYGEEDEAPEGKKAQGDEEKEPDWTGLDIGRGNKFNAGRGVGQGQGGSDSKGYKYDHQAMNDRAGEGDEEGSPDWGGLDIGRGNKFNSGRGLGQGSGSKGYKVDKESQPKGGKKRAGEGAEDEDLELDLEPEEEGRGEDEGAEEGGVIDPELAAKPDEAELEAWGSDWEEGFEPEGAKGRKKKDKDKSRDKHRSSDTEWLKGADAFDKLRLEFTLNGGGSKAGGEVILLERQGEELLLEVPKLGASAGQKVSFSVVLGKGSVDKNLEIDGVLKNKEPADEGRELIWVTVDEDSRAHLGEIQTMFDVRQEQLLSFLREAKGDG